MSDGDSGSERMTCSERSTAGAEAGSKTLGIAENLVFACAIDVLAVEL